MNTRIFKAALFLSVVLYFNNALAAKVDTVLTYSPSMKKNIKATVVLPDGYSTAKQYPVLYLLHGYSGNYGDYVNNAPVVKELADRYQMIMIGVDGNFSSWYFDSPIDSSFRYETYVAKELISWVDKNYSTIKDRSGRGICGLSMGGHGALYLAIKHQDVFGAAGSMSGGVDFRPFPKNWDIAKRLGTYEQNQKVWTEHTVMGIINELKPNSLAIMMDCGVDDFFYPVNLALHQKLLEMKIAHVYIADPGEHSWTYWSNDISYQALFMHKFFVHESSAK